MWLAVVGYGLAYAGAVKVGGGQCGVIDGFRGKCPGAVRTQSASSPGSGITVLAAQQANAAQQGAMIGAQPISQVA